MGIVVSFVPEEESPFNDLPWVVTFKPADEDAWDAVVCGPYQREHAEALAEAVALETDDDVVAVAEPLLPALDPESIREAIDQSRELAAAAEELDDLDDDTDSDEDDEDVAEADFDDESDEDDAEVDEDAEEVEHLEVPEAPEIRDGIDRVTRRLVAELDEVVHADA